MQLENSVIAGIMIPDALTPGQYYDGIRADDSCARPIKRLMLAVLEDAMRCYQTYTNSRSRAQRRMFVEAEAWLMDRKAEGPFAFETVCETLGINPSCLRDGLRRWRFQQLDGLNPRRLARRSPVTRVGRISAPLKRRRRKPSEMVAGDGGSIAVAVNANGNGNGVAPHRDGLAHDGLGFGEHGSEIENTNGSLRGFSTRIDVEQAAVA
jgi:hypothetical protein